MKKRIKMLPRLLLLLLVVFFFSEKRAYASAGTGTEYITISVNASDDNGDLQYAIDEPVNFSEKNTFTIPAGSSHTIYVKDAAGNITSQQYPATASSSSIIAPESGSSPAMTTQTQEITAGSGEQEINIDLELGLKPDGINAGGEASASVRSGDDDNENYEYLTDTVVEKPAAAVQSKTTTDGSDTAKKVFYDIVTAEGETFYLVIDQGASNTVHLLNKVTLKDLEAIADAADDSASPAVTEEKEDNLLEALKRSETGSDTEAGAVQKASAEKGSSDMLLLIGVVAIAAGGYYYFKVYKNKKNETMDAMDAMDMDDFQLEDEEDEDEEEIEFDEDRKQKLLDDLISSDGYATENELYDTDPEEYAADAAPEPETEDREIGDRKMSEPDEQESKGQPFTEEEDNRFVDEEFAEALSAAVEFDEELDGEEE